MTKCLLGLGIAGVAALVLANADLWAAEPQQQPTLAASTSPERGLLDQYCVRCHNDRARAGGLALDTVDVENVSGHAEVWEKAVRKLRARAMPPAGLPRPDERGYHRLVSYLETELDAAAAANPDPGRTDTVRRLNRTEYQNAIRDLLRLEVDVTELLPKDDVSFGFDNVSAVGLSPSLMERYLLAAQKISRLALGSPVPTPGSRVVVLPVDLTQEEHVDGLPFGTRGGTAVRHAFPRDGVYDVQVRLMRNRNENVEGLTEPHQMEITLDGERLQLFTVTSNRNRSGSYYADEDVDKHLNLRMRVKAGPHAVGRDLPAEERGADRDRASAVPGALQHEPASPYSTGRPFRLDRRPLRCDRSRGHAEPRPYLRVPPASERGGSGLRPAHHLDVGSTSVPTAGDRPRSGRSARVL